MHPVVIYIVLSIAGIALGIFLSKSYVDYLAHGNAVEWKRLPAPPSPPTGLLDADINRLFIQTEGGIYFSASMKQCLEPGGEPCWSLVDKVDQGQLYLRPCPAGNPPFFETPTPPTKYSQSLLVQECGPDSHGEIHYMLGEDGGIWFWRHSNYAPGLVNVMVLSSCIGASLGLIAGLFLANRIVVRRKKN
jgi:uncharacterized protein YneF (UPF0154 family)